MRHPTCDDVSRWCPQVAARSPRSACAGLRPYRVRMERPPLTVTSVVIGAREPRELAAFYERLLGWQIVANEPARPGFPPEDGWAMLRSPSDRGVMAIAVQWEPDYEPPVWPARKGEPAMMLHLDIQADDGNVANA